MTMIQLMFLSLIGLDVLINIGIILSILRVRTNTSTNPIQVLLISILGFTSITIIIGLIVICYKLSPALIV